MILLGHDRHDAMFTGVGTFETITVGNVAMTMTLGAQAQEGGIATVTLGNATNSVDASAFLLHLLLQAEPEPTLSLVVAVAIP